MNKILKTKKFYTLASTLALGVLVSFAMPAVVNAANTDPTEDANSSGPTGCRVETVGTKNGAGDADSKFRIESDTAFIKFKVIGGDKCKRVVQLKSYLTPKANGEPKEDQRKYLVKERTFTPGNHQMSITLPGEPGCFFQINFLRVNRDLEPGEKLKRLGKVVGGDHNCLNNSGGGGGSTDDEEERNRCISLTAKTIDEATRNYSFQVKYYVRDVAELKSVDFNFGDKTTLLGVKPAQLDTVRHAYASAGTYTATAVLSIQGENGTIYKRPCAVEVKPTGVGPAFACTQLKSTVVDEAARSYKLSVEYVASNGPVLNFADVDFGDGTVLKMLTPDKLKDIPHTYAESDNYVASAVLNFTVNGEVQQASCSVPVTFQGKAACATDANLPKDSADCIKLVSTGPTETIGLVVVIVALSSAGYFIYLRRRKA